MKHIHNNKGWVGPVFKISLIAVFLYAAFKFSVPYYRYTMMNIEVKEISRLTFTNKKRPAKMVFDTAINNGIVIDKKDIFVELKDDMLRIQMSWYETVNLFGRYKKTLYFDIDVTN